MKNGIFAGTLVLFLLLPAHVAADDHGEDCKPLEPKSHQGDDPVDAGGGAQGSEGAYLTVDITAGSDEHGVSGGFAIHPECLKDLLDP